MLVNHTHERLATLGLPGMAKAFDDQQRQPDTAALNFEVRLGLMIDREVTERDNKRLVARLKFAALRQAAVIEDIDLRTPRGIERAFFAKLVDGDWIARKQNLLITGPTGVGKSWIACALGHKACRDNRSVLYHRMPRLFEALALARGDLEKPRKIDLPLVELRRGGMRVGREGDKRAQHALTDLAPRERFGNYTLCTCLPRTGRTHQVRVHLAAAGHPLAIDPRYGDDRPLRIGDLWSGAPDPDTVVLQRTPLHALSLRLPHPSGRGWLQVESPLADDMARCLDLLRAARRET